MGEEVEVDIEEGPEIENIGEAEFDHELEDAGETEMTTEAEVNHDFENTNDFETGAETEIAGEIEHEDDIEEELGTHDPFSGMTMGKSLKDQFSAGEFGGKFTQGVGLGALMKNGAIGGIQGRAMPQPSFQHVQSGPTYQPQMFAVPQYTPQYAQPYTMGYGW